MKKLIAPACRFFGFVYQAIIRSGLTRCKVTKYGLKRKNTNGNGTRLNELFMDFTIRKRKLSENFVYLWTYTLPLN